MLPLILSLFSLHDLFSCVNCEEAKFDESLLMNHHHQNFLRIKDFIKKAQHKFHEERSVLREDDYELESTRNDELLDHNITNWWWDSTTSIDQLGLNTPQTFFLPLTRSRPSFPYSITPYTTELNNRHLRWDEIFPTQSLYTRSSESRLRIGPEVSSTSKNSTLPQPPSKTFIPGLKNRKPFGPTFRPPKSYKYSRPLNPNTTSTDPNTFVTGHSGQPFGHVANLIILNEEYKKVWLREITTYTPVEIWFKTLATQTGVTPSNDYTTKGVPQVDRPLSKAQASNSTKELKNISKDQPPLILRQGIPLPDTPTEEEDYGHTNAGTVTAKTAPFFIEDVVRILHLKTIPEKDEEKTKMIDERPTTVLNDSERKVIPTVVSISLAVARDVQHREQDPDTPEPSSNKSRRFHSKAKKRKYHHHLQKRYKARERHQNDRCKHPGYSNKDIFHRHEGEVEYRMLRRTPSVVRRRFSMNTSKQQFTRMNKVTRPTENMKHPEPTELPKGMLQYSEHDDTEGEKLIKFIERRDESNRKMAQKDKTSFYHRVKESLKQAESNKKAKRLKLKAKLLRKIADGSSYSDEEATLTKNLIRALQYGNRIFENNVAQNNIDRLERTIR